MNETTEGDFWDKTDYVVVYLYRFWDAKAETLMVSRDRATLLAIRSGLGTPMTDTGVKVPRTEVDSYGRHRGVVNYPSGH